MVNFQDGADADADGTFSIIITQFCLLFCIETLLGNLFGSIGEFEEDLFLRGFQTRCNKKLRNNPGLVFSAKLIIFIIT